jgi:hypothetical protein
VVKRPFSEVFDEDASYICANLEVNAFPLRPDDEAAKRQLQLTGVISPLMTQLALVTKTKKGGPAPAGTQINLLLAIDRLLRSPHVHRTALDVPNALAALERVLISDDDLVAFRCVVVLFVLFVQRVCSSRDPCSFARFATICSSA